MFVSFKFKNFNEYCIILHKVVQYLVFSIKLGYGKAIKNNTHQKCPNRQ